MGKGGKRERTCCLHQEIEKEEEAAKKQRVNSANELEGRNQPKMQPLEKSSLKPKLRKEACMKRKSENEAKNDYGNKYKSPRSLKKSVSNKELV